MSTMKKLILHLGGGLHIRAKKCIELAHRYKDAKILISSENPDALDYYYEQGISEDRVYHDTTAWDTVTNFTHTLNLIRREYKPNELLVVAHGFQMKRVMAIANAVYFLRGIKITPVEADQSSKIDDYVLQDAFRAWFWRFTGVLFYWKSVRDERVKTYTPRKNEVPMEYLYEYSFKTLPKDTPLLVKLFWPLITKIRDSW
ncbi:MAG: YdcF family protein [Aliivibrio sp.]|nr:YdcF family protein [Aliivibrio sp.]